MSLVKARGLKEMAPNEASGRSSEPAPIPASKLIFILIQYSFRDSGHNTTISSSLCTVDSLYLFLCYLWIYRGATKVKTGRGPGDVKGGEANPLAFR